MTDPARPGLRCGQVGNQSPEPPLGQPFIQPGNTWGDRTPADLQTACVDAMYAGGEMWDMLGAWLGRDGMDGQGRAAGIGVGWQTESAHFDPSQPGGAVILGAVPARTQNPEVPEPGTPPDPEGRQYSDMDTVGHEYGHQVFDTTPGGANDTLENRALNEGSATIFAMLAIAFAGNPNVPLTYRLGDQIGQVSVIMYHPSLIRGYPDCYSPALFTNAAGEPLPIDPEAHRFGHEEAGPLLHWFYLLAEGSNPPNRSASPTCDGSTLTGLGIQLAGTIFYDGLLKKTPTWKYRDARSSTLTAALRLFPGTCTVFDKVKAAWNAVSVPALPEEPTCAAPAPTPTPTPSAPAPTPSAVPPPTAPGLPRTGAASPSTW